MKQKDILKVFSLIAPNLNEGKFVKEYGLLVWLCIAFTKAGLFLLVLWFLVMILDFHIEIGKS